MFPDPTALMIAGAWIVGVTCLGIVFGEVKVAEEIPLVPVAPDPSNFLDNPHATLTALATAHQAGAMATALCAQKKKELADAEQANTEANVARERARQAHLQAIDRAFPAASP